MQNLLLLYLTLYTIALFADATSETLTSFIPKDPGEEAPLCEVPTTVTITGDRTVTILVTVVPSQVSLQSQSAASDQISTESSASIQSQFSVAPIASETAVPTPSGNTIQADEKIGQFTSPANVAYSSIPNPVAKVPAPSSFSASESSIGPASTSTSSNSLTPNGVKAGVAGYQSITKKSSWNQFAPHIGWYSDYWPNTPDSGAVRGIGMVSLRPKYTGRHISLIMLIRSFLALGRRTPRGR